ncbi:MAG: hypothetical protein RLZZ544_1302 [Actinomycetota bacterium]
MPSSSARDSADLARPTGVISNETGMHPTVLPYHRRVRYLFAVIADRRGVAAADPGEMAAIDAFNDRLVAAGQRVIAVGIQDPSGALVFDNRAGAGTVSQGPAVDADDFMAGLWILEIGSQTEAHALAAEASRACNRRIEVRAIL